MKDNSSMIKDVAVMSGDNVGRTFEVIVSSYEAWDGGTQTIYIGKNDEGIIVAEETEIADNAYKMLYEELDSFR